MTDGITWTHGSPDGLRRTITDPKIVGIPFAKFLNSMMVLGQGSARENAPVDRGQLRQSIGFRIATGVRPLWGKYGTNKKYAQAQEYGTQSLSTEPSITGGTPFPTGPELETWARRHGFKSGSIVAAAIRKNGGVIPKSYFKISIKFLETKLPHYLTIMAHDIMAEWRKVSDGNV